ncbi:P-type ATPase [Zalerion maritima]|uniref:P-type Na(+) transporter n=1 Tax=Zalerion maritima TaxID=339359 RepID=A0AAD5RXD2_9PEZI|nr:P-type ATPase [Zalerion maritima]
MATSGEETLEAQTEPPICGLKRTSSSLKRTSDQSSLVTATNSIVNPPEFDPDLAHTLSASYVCTFLGTNISNGLSNTEAARRLQQDGQNKIEGDKGVSLWTIFMRQIANSLTAILAVTAGISYFIHDFVEGSVIAAVIAFNIVVGFVQDLKAEKKLQALYSLSAPTCKVIRDGQTETVPAADIVKGDLVALSVGDICPADLRLANGINLSADEALLTGESVPVQKHPERVLNEGDLALGDRSNIAYSATIITRGRGVGIVTSTGMGTKVGQIASDLRAPSAEQLEEESKTGLSRLWCKLKNRVKFLLGLNDTPLKTSLNKFALLLFVFAAILAITVFSVNLWNLDGPVLLYGIVVAVAVVPESLNAVIIVSSAIGVKKMAEGNVIVRVLSSLEAVGGVTHIASDKTGTLTEGKMIVQKVWLSDKSDCKVTNVTDPHNPTSLTTTWGRKHPPSGEKSAENGEETSNALSTVARAFLDTVALCNSSSVTENSDGTWKTVGDPTEVALQVFARHLNFDKERLISDRNADLVAEYPFDSSIKRMSVIYGAESETEVTSYTKGAIETLLPLLDITEENKKEIIDMADTFADQGLRVLCVARRVATRDQLATREEAETQLEFLGLAGLRDPPRPESLGAVRQCKVAGTTVTMLTGDHIKTASTIAREVGILENGETPTNNPKVIMEARSFDVMCNEEVDALPQLPLVIARCNPRTKVRFVDAVHRRGGFCVMTGDGVNDSPALKKANIGIAMGKNGSDVAKEAADMLLCDDNFASIVVAVKEGRRLFDNVQKFLLHLLVSNIAQVILLLIALAFKDSHDMSVFPLSPIEILWANLITSSPLAIGLGIEEATLDVMSRPPHDLKVGIFTKELIIDKFVYGTSIGALCLATFASVTYGMEGKEGLGTDCNEDFNDTCNVAFRARAATYATLTCLLIVTAFEAKHFMRSLFNMYPGEKYSVLKAFTKNKVLLWGAVAGVCLLFPIIYAPVVNRVVFKHQGITWEWGLVAAAVVIYVATVEMWKALKRRFKPSTLKRCGTSGTSETSASSVV